MSSVDAVQLAVRPMPVPVTVRPEGTDGAVVSGTSGTTGGQGSVAFAVSAPFFTVEIPGP
ncbi:hypothetical protein D3C74_300920 [compost metagenome]